MWVHLDISGKLLQVSSHELQGLHKILMHHGIPSELKVIGHRFISLTKKTSSIGQNCAKTIWPIKGNLKFSTTRLKSIEQIWNVVNSKRFHKHFIQSKYLGKARNYLEVNKIKKENEHKNNTKMQCKNSTRPKEALYFILSIIKFFSLCEHGLFSCFNLLFV